MDADQIIKEMQFKAVRSSGPGGQHINKTATKVAVHFNVSASQGLTEAEKELLNQRLANRLNSDGELHLQCGETRSQHRNKLRVMSRLITLLKENLVVAKTRKKSKPSKGAVEKRLKSKRQHALKKANRKPPKLD